MEKALDPRFRGDDILAGFMDEEQTSGRGERVLYEQTGSSARVYSSRRVGSKRSVAHHHFITYFR